MFGKTIVCDEEDMETIKQKIWTVTNKGDFVTKGKDKVTQKLGRFIFSLYNNIPVGMCVCYKNKNHFDVRKENLILKTYSQKNKGIIRTSTGKKCKGYYFNKKRWSVLIRIDGKLKFFGSFKNEEYARKMAHDILMQRRFGQCK